WTHPRIEAAPRRVLKLVFPAAYPWSAGIRGESRRHAGDRVGLEHEKRVVVVLVVVPQTQNRHDVAGGIAIAVLVDVRKEFAALAKLDAFFACELVHLEQLGVLTGEVDEALDTALVVDAVARKIQTARQAPPTEFARTVPCTAGTLEGVEHEI